MEKKSFLSKLKTQAQIERDLFINRTSGLNLTSQQIKELSLARKAFLLIGGVCEYAIYKALIPSLISVRRDVPHNSVHEKTVIYAEGIETVGAAMIMVGLANLFSGQGPFDSVVTTLSTGIGIYAGGKVLALGANVGSIVQSRRH